VLDGRKAQQFVPLVGRGDALAGCSGCRSRIEISLKQIGFDLDGQLAHKITFNFTLIIK
jgi:hypothetical protein